MTEPTATEPVPAVLAHAEQDEAILTWATAPEDEDPLSYVGEILDDDELAAEGLEP